MNAVKESDTPQDQHNTAKDTNQSKNKGAGSKNVAAGSKNAPTTNEADDPDNSKNPSKTLAWLKKHVTVTLVVELLVLLVGIKVACIYSAQLNQMIESNKITLQTLKVSQGAYVTIGRKDGVVADFIIPKDAKQNAEIVIYFQNSGHLPAEFAWGTVGPILLTSKTKNYTGISSVHPYQGLSYRTRDKKNGSIGQGGGSNIIAGDSILVSTLGTISQKDLASLAVDQKGFIILGMFGYCDELGTYSVRLFGLRYRNNAAQNSLTFDLANDSAGPILPLPQSTDTTEYLPPCKTLNEK